MRTRAHRPSALGSVLERTTLMLDRDQGGISIALLPLEAYSSAALPHWRRTRAHRFRTWRRTRAHRPSAHGSVLERTALTFDSVHCGISVAQRCPGTGLA
eukprot:10505384-Heterocapsa_arctica.AAC.1